jgi:transposase InsO family protein
VAPGGWPGAGTTGARTSTRSTCPATANKHDAVAAVERALVDYEALFGRPLRDQCPVDPETGQLLPVVTIVTNNGGPFRSLVFEAFIELHPELAHARTRVRTPGQNGSRERGFGTLKYERLDAVTLAERAEDYRVEYNEIRPHEAIAWNRPKEVHLGLADPTTPTFETNEVLPTP